MESFNEIRGILRDIDERGWEDALPNGGPGAFLQTAARACAPPPAAPKAFLTSVVAMPRMPSGGTAMMLDLFPAAAPQAVPSPRRNSAAFAVLIIAGLLIFGATGLVVEGSGLPHPAAGASGKGQSRPGDSPEAAARAALPPALIPAIAKGHAAVAPLPAAAAKPKPLPAAYERTGPAAGASAAAARRAEDRALGKSLRQAGDAKILEGDIASARLFYERAADTGDAQAALDLGNSFNPAFLDRLGVLGMHGDVVAAARWYRRARMLGSPDAEKALRSLPR